MGSLETEVDALVVGAGVGGIYATYRLSRMGLSVKCVEKGGDVGGTWYWNRYPGAMSDTESYLYRYSWDTEDLLTYPWTHHYVYQPEILDYLRHVVAKHDLRRYMTFDCEMTSATWEDSTQRWRVMFSTGEAVVSRYLVNSLGLLSKPNYPAIVGLDSYKGKLVHTASWDESIDLKDKKVGIIGNGSTGVQVMTAIAGDVGRLISFQRHPQYSVPSGQGPVSAEYRQRINANYEAIYKDLWTSNVAFGIPESTRKTMEATPQERRQAFQDVWDQGNGFRFMFSAFGDITTDLDANMAACDFIRSKIDEIVKDPAKARILKPKELYAKRPLCDAGYYQIFNLDHVDVVDLQETPIDQVVPAGIKLSDGTIHELDVLICATGFESFEGGYENVIITGRDGETLQRHWQHGPTAYGAVACSGFPNMFVISGPQGPFANFPPVIESETGFIMRCIDFAERGAGSPVVMDVLPEAERGWSQLCERLVKGSLFTMTPSWIFGQNIVGRKPTINFYFGGLRAYRQWADKEVSDGLPGFRKTLVPRT